MTQKEKEEFASQHAKESGYEGEEFKGIYQAVLNGIEKTENLIARSEYGKANKERLKIGIMSINHLSALGI